jgi:hypothetical protein
MNFDDQIRRYFGTTNLAAVTPAALDAGNERMLVDLGRTEDRGRAVRLVGSPQHFGIIPGAGRGVQKSG